MFAIQPVWKTVIYLSVVFTKCVAIFALYNVGYIIIKTFSYAASTSHNLISNDNRNLSCWYLPFLLSILHFLPITTFPPSNINKTSTLCIHYMTCSATCWISIASHWGAIGLPYKFYCIFYLFFVCYYNCREVAECRDVSLVRQTSNECKQFCAAQKG